jgi:hypothetical protein
MSTLSNKIAKGGPLPGLLRPPIVFLFAILLGVIVNLIWPLPIVSSIAPIGIVLALAAAVLSGFH